MSKTEIAPVAEESAAADAPSAVTRVEMEVETQTLERSSSRNTPGRTRSKADMAFADAGQTESKGDADPAKSSSSSSAGAQASQPEAVKPAEGSASRMRSTRGSAKSRTQSKSSKAEAVDDTEADGGDEEEEKHDLAASSDSDEDDEDSVITYDSSPEMRKLLLQWVQKLLPSDEEILRFHRRMQTMSLGALERKLKRRRQEVEEPMFSDDDGATDSDREDAREPVQKRHKPSIDPELDKFVDHYISLRAQAERISSPAVPKLSQASSSPKKRQSKRQSQRQ